VTEPTPPAVAPDERSALDDPAEGVAGVGEPEPVSKWQRWARWIGFGILVVVSIHGIREFVNGDAAAVKAYWISHYQLLPMVLVFAMVDVSVEVMAWMWVYQRFGIRAFDRTGAAVGLSGKAGLLLPAQLGRLIRPDEMVRLGRGALGECLKAEAVVFVLDSISVLALFAALVAYRVHGALSLVAGATVIGVCLFLGNFILKLLSDTKLELPRGFWLSWTTFAIIVLQSTGWIAHGLAFFMLASNLPGDVGLWDSLFLAPGSAVLGLGSGVPGGIGATEALLGASMGFRGVPPEHLAAGVAAFRIVTFWLLLPMGWLALAYVGRQARKQREAADGRADRGGAPDDQGPGLAGDSPGVGESTP